MNQEIAKFIMNANATLLANKITVISAFIFGLILCCLKASTVGSFKSGLGFAMIWGSLMILLSLAYQVYAIFLSKIDQTMWALVSFSVSLNKT